VEPLGRRAITGSLQTGQRLHLNCWPRTTAQLDAAIFRVQGSIAHIAMKCISSLEQECDCRNVESKKKTLRCTYVVVIYLATQARSSGLVGDAAGSTIGVMHVVVVLTIFYTKQTSMSHQASHRDDAPRMWCCSAPEIDGCSSFILLHSAASMVTPRHLLGGDLYTGGHNNPRKASHSMISRRREATRRPGSQSWGPRVTV
jgi:hypothetical protein